MLFSSITFIYYFLPITLILYFIVPVGRGKNPLHGKNSLLLLASFLFYAMGEPIYVFLMMASVIVGYFGGRIIEKFPRKMVVFSFVGMQLALLGVFKYTDFFIDTWNGITGFNVSFLRLALPIGISFYSFQIVSYLVDVYRQDMKAETSFINFAAYITMFPQLIAGPIVRYDVVQEQMVTRQINFEKVSDGATRFLIGLGKKVLIADNLSELLLRLEKVPDKSMWSFWIIAIMYVLQVYHDFSGYSDMAIGLGKMLGFHFPENFNYPLISKSITEFWRRWHISLGTFLKDYIYIPLGGSRCTLARWAVNIGIVWFLSGLWHGASWNFVLWGLYFGVFLVLEKLCSKGWNAYVQSRSHKTGLKVGKNKTDNNRRNITLGQRVLHGLQRSYMSIVIIISFVLFRFVELDYVIYFLSEMFRLGNNTVSWIEWYEYRNVAFLVFIGIVGATPLAQQVVKRGIGKIKNQSIVTGIEVVFQIVMLIVVTAFLIQSSVHPFLYFRF